MTRRKRALENLDRDIRDHIERETEDNIERGMRPEEARQAALRKFGNVTRVAEDTREVWRLVWVHQLIQDVRYGIRMLQRNPGFTLVVIVTLALGIGMNAAVFSFVNAVLLRPLPYPNPERLVWLTTYQEANSEVVMTADFLDWREQAQSFEQMVAYQTNMSSIGNGDDAIRTGTAQISDGFWRLSGARPAFGHLIQPGEDGVVLSHGLFARRFSSDPAVVGKAVMLDGRQVTVAGVLPKDFRFLAPARSRPDSEVINVEAYAPLILRPEARVRGMGMAVSGDVLAKLKRGIPIERARAEMEALEARLSAQNPNPFFRAMKTRLVSLDEKLVGGVRPALRVLMAAVVFVLLIACVNIANLLLARAASRHKEIAIRVSVGAGPGRVMRQFLAESMILALLGGVAGLVLARWAIATLLRLLPQAVPRLAETTLDGRVLLFVLLVSIAAGVFFGFAPAFFLWRTNLHDVLKDSARASFGAVRGSVQVRGLLVAAELALAIVLLSGAGLMLKSFWRLHAHPPGFHPENILTVSLSGPPFRATRQADLRELLLRLETTPGVQSAGITVMGGMGFGAAPALRPGQVSRYTINGISESYSRVIGMRLLMGRWITDEEREKVAIINESAARYLFRGDDPIGRTIKLPRQGPTPTIGAVVGIVADLKYSKLDADPEPQVYIPLQQVALRHFAPTVVVRTTGDPLAIAPTLRKLVSDIYKGQAVVEARSLEQALADSIAPRRFNLFLLGTFAATALLLALVGIYGVIAYTVTQRTHDIGVCMALGAQRGDVVRMVVGQAMTIAVVGIGIGLVAALGLTRLMESLLYEVRPNDPPTLATVAVTLAATALLACWVPAIKAALVDPAIALRHE
jgi:putative ABC transport system permease protein